MTTGLITQRLRNLIGHSTAGLASAEHLMEELDRIEERLELPRTAGEDPPCNDNEEPPYV